jgi:hypothetical protein
MMTFIPPRLRKPAIYALAGALFAAAWLVRGGPLWWASIIAVIGTATGAVRLYRLGGTDTDEGARAGSRADERQQLLVTLLITGYGYLLGLGNYGIAEEGTPDDADTGRQRRPPVSS